MRLHRTSREKAQSAARLARLPITPLQMEADGPGRRTTSVEFGPSGPPFDLGAPWCPFFDEHPRLPETPRSHVPSQPLLLGCVCAPAIGRNKWMATAFLDGGHTSCDQRQPCAPKASTRATSAFQRSHRTISTRTKVGKVKETWSRGVCIHGAARCTRTSPAISSPPPRRNRNSAAPTSRTMAPQKATRRPVGALT